MRFVAIVVFLVSALAQPCFADDTENSVEQLQWLDTADPVKDAHAAIAKGDRRLKAVADITVLVPGVPPQEENAYREQFGVTVISGTSDALESKEHALLNSLAIRYAKQYNREVKKSVQK